MSLEYLVLKEKWNELCRTCNYFYGFKELHYRTHNNYILDKINEESIHNIIITTYFINKKGTSCN